MTGATGYIGRHLLPELLKAGHEVRAMSRHPDAIDLPKGATAVAGDLLSGDGVDDAVTGCDTAYYLVHSMEAGDESFAARDAKAARAFAKAANGAGVRRTIYLGGLEGENTPSEHLRSRHEVASILRDELEGELVYARAAMVIGEGSAAFEMIRHLVARLPAMIAPRWIATRTQPIAIADATRALAVLATLDQAPEEVQLGGADVISYRDMMERYALLTGRRRPLIVPVPVLSPWLSSHWVALITPVDRNVVSPLIEGLGTEMVVTDPPPPGINDDPAGYAAAVRAALGRPRFGAIVSDLSTESSLGADGAVRSQQAAEIELPADATSGLWDDRNLERLARTYWAYLSRCTLGLIRVRYTADERYVCLVSRRLPLLTFDAPRYERFASHARVRWRIKRGLLVAASDVDGFLAINVTDLGPGADGYHRVRINVEVENFYPAISSSISRFVYAHTQSRIHVAVTFGFLRRLVRRELDQSVTGRFA